VGLQGHSPMHVYTKAISGECLPAFVKQAACTLGPLFFTPKKSALTSSFPIHSCIFPHRCPRVATLVGLGPLRARVSEHLSPLFPCSSTPRRFRPPPSRPVLSASPLPQIHGRSLPPHIPPARTGSLLPVVLPVRRPPLRASVRPSQLLHTLATT
jgi:hypothetical protein